MICGSCKKSVDILLIDSINVCFCANCDNDDFFTNDEKERDLRLVLYYDSLEIWPDGVYGYHCNFTGILILDEW